MWELLIFLVILVWMSRRWFLQAQHNRARRDVLDQLIQAHDAHLSGEISDKAFVKRSAALEASLRLLEARR